MKQTKKQSIVESITQTVIGLVTSFLIQLIIYPILNIPVTFSQNLIITFVFFLASILRGYVIRRFFNNKLKCDEKI
jgi:high-affinity Fe2+/Pb2+ permease